MRIAVVCAVSLVSCQYVKDRAADALDPYKIRVGGGTVIGVRAEALGLVDTGIMVGMKPRATSLGWDYGTPLYLDLKDPEIDADQAQLVYSTSLLGLDYSRGSYESATNSVAILPALFTWTDSTPEGYAWVVPETGADFEDRAWLWSGRTFADNRYAQIHAFDVEAEVAIFAYLGAGFSPGEFVDFLLGFLTIDIAGDDDRW